jgi:DNA-binding IclR family transcriptional regulator
MPAMTLATNGNGDGSSGEVVALRRRAGRPAGGAHFSRGGRGLRTARAVLKVISFMAQYPQGVSAREVAEELGKSVSTAYYLLASLHEEGFALHVPGRGYRLSPEIAIVTGTPGPSLDDGLSRSADELFARTHRRTYLAKVETGAIVITATRGRQGIPRIPGLGLRIGASAHAVAMGKVVLSQLAVRGRQRYIERGLRRYTTRTITSPAELMSELERVRDEGFAIDRGEFDPGYCCVAAPVLGERGQFLAVLGLSTSSRTFEAERSELVSAVREVAASAGGAPRPRRPPADAGAPHVHTRHAA